MEKLTKKEVEHIAALANIALNDDEVALFQEQLTDVITYNMRLLSEVSVDGVPPTAQTTGLHNVWRTDDVQPSLEARLALSQAPAQHDGQFKVKRVLGDS